MASSGRGGSAAGGKGTGRKALLIDFVEKKVSVITNDGRNVVGRMRGFDQVCNVIIDECVERVFATDAGVQIVPLGLYVLRGDNIAVIGEVDAEIDDGTAWETIMVCCCMELPLAVVGEGENWHTTLAIYLHEHVCGNVVTFRQGTPLNPVVH